MEDKILDAATAALMLMVVFITIVLGIIIFPFYLIYILLTCIINIIRKYGKEKTNENKE